MDPTWWRIIVAAIVGIIIFQDLCSSEKPPNYTFMHDATRAPGISFYDYIVIGGGTAGCPLAATLSEQYSVLLLERGDSPYGNPNVTVATNYGSFFGDTSPNSVAQRFVSEDGVSSARARVLGGGTSINAGFYSHGEPEFVRDAGLLDEKLVNESYRWVEKAIVFQPNVRQWQSAFREALLEVGVVPFNGQKFDHLVGCKLGSSIFDENGTRHTAADLLQYANPKGLSLFLNASVHKILLKNKGKSRPMAYGVVFEDALGNKHKAYLRGGPRDEVILSAGAIGSPQLLLLSGVGPKDQLKAHKIEVVLDQPLVGQHMADNPLSIVFVPSPNPVEVSFVQIVGITQFGSYIEGGSGLNLIGGSLADFEGFSPQSGGFIFEKVNGPVSSGNLKLRNRNPADNPSVRFNYFKETIDLKKCVSGVRTILNAIEAKAFSNFKYSNMTSQDILNLAVRFPTSLPIHANTSTSLEQFCKDTVRTIFHYHGGCHIGKVVDHEYKVIGVDALRVVDGSTFLRSPGTNPQATVMMMGRYMGVKILTKRITSGN